MGSEDVEVEGFFLGGRVLWPTLSFESIYFIHIIRLMIPPIEMHKIGIKNFKPIQQQSNFRRPRSSIYEITIEQEMMCFRRESISSENLKNIVELTYSLKYVH